MSRQVGRIGGLGFRGVGCGMHWVKRWVGAGAPAPPTGGAGVSLLPDSVTCSHSPVEGTPHGPGAGRVAARCLTGLQGVLERFLLVGAQPLTLHLKACHGCQFVDVGAGAMLPVVKEADPFFDGHCHQALSSSLAGLGAFWG